LSLVVSGIPNAVASLGTAFTTEHLELLKGKDIILAFDNDEAGHKTMAKLIEESPQLPVFVLDNFSDSFKDFNDALMNGVDLKDVMANKKRLYGPEFLFVYLKNTLDLSELKNREELFYRVSKASKYSSPIAKDYYAIKIQRLFKGRRSK
jgi:DNA primase